MKLIVCWSKKSNEERGHTNDSKDKLKFRGSEPDADEVTDTAADVISWSSAERHFVYVTDSKLLQEVVCGQASMQGSKYTPILSRILDRIAGHLACQWTPPYLWDEPVRWLPRSYNKVADGLADLTMDRRETWTRRFASGGISGSNLIVQTDGGLREGDCAAASFIIGCWRMGKYEPLVAHGTYLKCSCTLFQAEAIALDEATAAVQTLIRGA